jgi:GntR family transcriptional regulator / MocR family aminotransferase
MPEKYPIAWPFDKAHFAKSRGATLSMNTIAFLDDIVLDRNSIESLGSQLARELRRLIRAGTIGQDVRLPSSRDLSKRLSIARNVVAEAYEVLTSEGVLATRHGSGTFVAADGSLAHAATRKKRTARGKIEMAPATLKQLRRAHLWSIPNPDLALSPGIPDLKSFPKQEWTRFVARAIRSGARYIEDTDPCGLLLLRQAIAAHVGPARGIACRPENIIILNSARQGFELITRLLTTVGETVIVEDPGYVEARETVLALGRKVLGCQISDEGIVLPRKIPRDVRAVFLTPTHQYPTGRVTPPNRMVQLSKLALANNVALVEDDYDGEFHHERRPSRALAAYEETIDDGKVIHIGTFSKSMFPSLRLAYLICPETLVEPLAQLRGLADSQPGTLHQVGLAEFICSGAYGLHVRKMRQLYARRKDALLQAIAESTPGILTPISSSSGLHVCCWIPATLDDEHIAKALKPLGIGATAISGYAIRPNTRPGLVLGFGNTPENVYPGLLNKIAGVITAQMSRLG